MAGRLSRALAACVALALIVMVVASTLVMRSWMLANMDSELHRLSQRAGERLDVKDAPGDEVDTDEESDDEADDDSNEPTVPVSRPASALKRKLAEGEVDPAAPTERLSLGPDGTLLR